ncbi:hypothetical protein Tco_0950490 [Tanacetum coccineum]
MEEEMDSLRKNKTWVLVDHPAGQKLVSCKCLFKIKEGIEGVFKEGQVQGKQSPSNSKVDDMLIACKSKAEIGSTKTLLKREFDMKELSGKQENSWTMGNRFQIPFGARMQMRFGSLDVLDGVAQRARHSVYGKYKSSDILANLGKILGSSEVDFEIFAGAVPIGGAFVEELYRITPYLQILNPHVLLHVYDQHDFPNSFQLKLKALKNLYLLHFNATGT